MQRRHDIDALRVIAFCLLILYHVGDGLRRRLGLPPQERLSGRMAAMADDRAQSLAHAAAVHDLRHRHRSGPGRTAPPEVRGDAQLAAAGAAAVRHVRGRRLPGLLRRPRQRPRAAGAVGVPDALLASAAVARRKLQRLGTWHHLEPSVVPGLPMAVHDAVAGIDPGAAADRGVVGKTVDPAYRGMVAAGRSCRMAGRGAAVAGTALPGNPCPVRRQDRACRIAASVPARLRAGHQSMVLGLGVARCAGTAWHGACWRSRRTVAALARPSPARRPDAGLGAACCPGI